ncbi:TIM barrel protein [uncultured Sphaerochaeta sp.]|uniref:TIM barrel protein n=1 Tax=uncultured Sphaerochaeta sp. TaxID=886478 RepID=UPI002A0A97CB|nr:TIM barrel protein [uncultured Sphaerochaeta sp.]
MQKGIVLGLNRIVSPSLSLPIFLTLAERSGFGAVELRNDLGKTDVTDGLGVEIWKNTTLRIVSINALQRFNDDEEKLSTRYSELQEMVRISRLIGVESIVLCPVNDKNDARSKEQRMEDTTRALGIYGPLFLDSGIQGLVEPLGFVSSSLRYKKDALDAIDQSGFPACYQLVHDTFHHYLSGEQELYPHRTALVHVSSVTVPTPLSSVVDDARLLPASSDELGSQDQIDKLLRGGFCGCISFEAFSPKVQALSLSQLESALHESLKLFAL